MKLATLIFLCLLGVQSLRGDEAAARTLAERVVDLVGSSELIQKVHAGTLDRVEKDLISRGMPAEGAAKVRKAFDDWFKQNFGLQEIRSRAAALYAKEFSEDELRQMVAFYETPAGQKAARKTALLGFKISAMAEDYTVKEQEHDALKKELEPILRKYGVGNPSVRRAYRSIDETNHIPAAVDKSK